MMTDSPNLPDYTRWEDDTSQSYALRVASQAIYEVGSLLCRIGDRLLDAAYPGSSVDLDTGGDGNGGNA
jgi:hypothetical protein